MFLPRVILKHKEKFLLDVVIAVKYSYSQSCSSMISKLPSLNASCSTAETSRSRRIIKQNSVKRGRMS